MCCEGVVGVVRVLYEHGVSVMWVCSGRAVIRLCKCCERVSLETMRTEMKYTTARLRNCACFVSSTSLDISSVNENLTCS